MSDRGRQKKKKVESKQVCGFASNPIHLTDRRRDLKAKRRGRK